MPHKADLINDIVTEISNWKSEDIEGFFFKRTGFHWPYDDPCISWVENTMRFDLSKKPKCYIEKMYRELEEVGRL